MNIGETLTTIMEGLPRKSCLAEHIPTGEVVLVCYDEEMGYTGVFPNQDPEQPDWEFVALAF